MKKLVIHIILIVLSICFIQSKATAQKTDTIYHVNGNILLGDFKKMVYGVVTWKMDGMGTISLEEVKIVTMKSKKLFEIKMKEGLIYFGSFDTSNVARKVYIKHLAGKDLVNIEDIVEIYPIKRNFWTRTSGNFSLGINYSKGSDVATATFSGNLDYRKRKTYFYLAWDDNNTIQADTLSSSKTDVTFAWQRMLKNNWSAELSIGGNQNTEMGTKLRLDLYAMGLKDFVYNNWNRLYVGGGLSVNRETPYDDSGITTDLAGLVQVVWKVYKFSTPKVWVDANVSFLPYFTGESRYRTVFNLYPQVSLFSDNFKAGVSFYYNTDSKPTSDASNYDYGINLQLTYTFH